MAMKTKIELAELIRQAAGQVCGADERAALFAWLDRITDDQVVEVDLDLVILPESEQAPHDPTPVDREEYELGVLESRLIERLDTLITDAIGADDVVLLQVQPPSSVVELAAQAAAVVLMGFERGYRLGGGDGDDDL